MIYISHPYGGLEKNKKRVEDIIKTLTKLYPNVTFVSPIHCFGFMYDYVPYDEGINKCLNLLIACNEMYVFGDYEASEGCKKEMEYCERYEIKYTIIDEKGGIRDDCGNCIRHEECPTKLVRQKLLENVQTGVIEDKLEMTVNCNDFISTRAISSIR